MWPRNDGSAGPGADMTASRKTKNSGLSGFVSFMTRKDAEEALRLFDGFEWGGCVLRVGWSKAVPVAARAMYSKSKRQVVADGAKYCKPASSLAKQHSRSRSPDDRHAPYGSHSQSGDRRSQSPRRFRRSMSRSRSPTRRRRSVGSDREEELITDTFIRAVAVEVKGQGPEYEAGLKRREMNNPKYAFMRREVGSLSIGPLYRSQFSHS